MNMVEELDACKYGENEYLVEHLIEVVQDEGINSLEELAQYEEKYFIESAMNREDWIKWYENSFAFMPDLETTYGQEAAVKINSLKKELSTTTDINKKIENIIKICVVLEKECCFLVEIYNLIVGGTTTGEEVVEDDIAPVPIGKELVPGIHEVLPTTEKVDTTLVTNNTLEISEVNTSKNIVLCGGIKFKEELLKVADSLEKLGFNPIVMEEFYADQYRKAAFKSQYDLISNPNNNIVLIVNVTKNGIPNYIGHSVFAQIAFAAYQNKKIVLLNDIYLPYRNDLTNWGVITLNGNLEKLKEII